jgi:hypothetical protein
MDDQTMFDLFDSLKREIKLDLQPVKDGLERIESRLTRQGGISGPTSPILQTDVMPITNTLNTWKGGPEQFQYEGSISTGTDIRYGTDFACKATITAVDYQPILRRFTGKEVQIGTSKDRPPSGSVGEWVKANINRSGLMSYIGPILVDEGYAMKPRSGWIRFGRFSNRPSTDERGDDRA